MKPILKKPSIDFAAQEAQADDVQIEMQDKPGKPEQADPGPGNKPPSQPNTPRKRSLVAAQGMAPGHNAGQPSGHGPGQAIQVIVVDRPSNPLAPGAVKAKDQGRDQSSSQAKDKKRRKHGRRGRRGSVSRSERKDDDRHDDSSPSRSKNKDNSKSSNSSSSDKSDSESESRSKRRRRRRRNDDASQGGEEIDCLNKMLKILVFLVKFGILMALGIFCLYVATNSSCSGEPGLIVFLKGVGAMLILQAIMAFAEYYYFAMHQNDHAGQCFRFINYLCQAVVLILAIYGVIEVCGQFLNDASEDAVSEQNGSCDATCESQYSCSTTLFYASIVSVIIAILFSLSLVYRIVNYYRIQDGPGTPQSVTYD